jgi:putative sterol carrier protein
MAETCAEAFEAMKEKFNPEAAAGLNAVFQYCLDGDGGGQWNCSVADGALSVDEGTHDSPSVTLSMAASDFLDLVNGKLNGQMAFMSGKLKIAGDMSLAMKLGSIFGM